MLRSNTFFLGNLELYTTQYLTTKIQWNPLYVIFIEIIYSRNAEPPGDIRRSSCGEDLGRLCSSVVRVVDRQSKDMGSNPSAVESVFFSTKRFSNSLNIEFICIICDIRVWNCLRGHLKSGHSKGRNPQFFKNRFFGETNSWG